MAWTATDVEATENVIRTIMSDLGGAVELTSEQRTVRYAQLAEFRALLAEQKRDATASTNRVTKAGLRYV